MKTITFSSFIGFCNRGAEALLKTRVGSIKKLIPEAKFYVLSIYTETCKPIPGVEYINTFGGRREKLRSIKYLISSAIKGIIWTTNTLILRFFGCCFDKNIKKIASSLVFISTDGDTLGEDYGLLPFLWRLYFLSLGIIMRKPVIIYAEGAGPFNNRIGRIIAKFIFDRCAYISVRDKISLKHLINLGIERKRINLFADSAFLLLPSPAKNFNYRRKGKRLIGIAVSKLAPSYGFPRNKEENPYKSFVNFMAELIDWMIENLNANVILISHVVQLSRDDYETAKDIFKEVKNKDQIDILNKDLNAAELKKAISYCDLVVTSRMHAAIAALSVCVPTIGIAYSHKMKGVYNVLGVSDLVINIKDLDWKITKKIQEVLIDSDEIKNQLRNNLVSAKKLAEKPSFEVAKILRREIITPKIRETCQKE